MAHVVSLRLGAWVCAMAPVVLPLPATALGPAQPFAAPAAQRGAAAPGDDPTGRTTARLSGLRGGAAPAALIDGQWITLGASVRQARLHDIQPPYAVLRHPDGRLERLALDSHPAGVPSPALVDKRLLP